MALRTSKDRALDPFVSAARLSRAELAQQLIDRVNPHIHIRLDSTEPQDAFKMIAMLHADIFFAGMSGQLLAGLRMMDTLLIMSREIPLVQLLKMDRMGEDWVRWEERRRLMWRLFLFDRVYTSLSSIRYFTIPLERMEKLPLPCADDVFASDDPSALAQTPVFLTMFKGGLQAYPLFLPQLSPLAKACVLQFLLTQIIDYQRQAPEQRTVLQKGLIEAQLAAWRECLPPHETTEVALATIRAGNVQQGWLPSVPNAHTLLFYHWIEVVLHSPVRGMNLLDDEEWLGSEDFLRAAEHANMIISLLEGMDSDVLPFWTVEAITISTMIHILLAKRLMGYQNEVIHRDLHNKVDTAIRVFEVLSERRPSTGVLAFVLKLVMTRIAHAGNYFADDPPPANLELEGIADGVRTALGFSPGDDMLGTLEALFGRQGRMLNTIRFVTGLLPML